MLDYYPDPESEEIYDAFLYGSVANQEDGTPISVLTALTRGNCDPWEEAARLARLDPDRAASELVRLLDKGVGRNVGLAGLEAAAERLVPSLPFRPKHSQLARKTSIRTEANSQLVYWIVWACVITILIAAQEHDRSLVAGSEAAKVRDGGLIPPLTAKHETKSSQPGGRRAE